MPPARTPAAKSKPAARPPRPRAATKRPAAKRPAAAAKAPARRVPSRADLGAPIDGMLARQPPHLRAILDALRALVMEVAPEATSSLKWGMPCFQIGGQMYCTLGAHRAHVNLILAGAPADFDDPDGRLEGAGRGGRHLKLTALADLPRAQVRRWLRVSAARARSRAL